MHPSAEAIGLAPALAVGLAVAARRSQVSRLRLAAGAVGVGLIFAAFFTQLEPLANHTFLWAHLLQNVVLAEWAPVLLVLAIPQRLAERDAGGRQASSTGEPHDSEGERGHKADGLGRREHPATVPSASRV